MKIGIVGLPYSGKKTLFSAIIEEEIDINHPSLMKNRYVANMVDIYDPRLEKLNEIYQPKKKVPAKIEFVYFMGIQQEKKDFKGFEAELLNHYKTMDGFIVVLKAFGDIGNLSSDFETILSEFMISDQIIIENRLERIEKQLKKTNDVELKFEKEVLEKLLNNIENNIPIANVEISDKEEKVIRGYKFLTQKPILIALNVDEEKWQQNIKAEDLLDKDILDRYKTFVISAEIEKEIALLEPNDREEFMKDYNIEEPATVKVIKSAFDLLNYIYFFTVGEDEVRAWPIKKGINAQKAAGTIHSDIEKGFIRAEVVHYDDFIACGCSMQKAKEKGLWRLEGKEYIVKDGDIINFRFAI